MKRKYRQFLTGYDKFSIRCQPTDEDIMKEVRRKGRDVDDHLYCSPRGDTHTTTTAQTAVSTEQREMAHLIDLLKDGGVGFMPERKSSGWIRLMFENWNSLGVCTHTWKMDRLNYLIKSLQVDVIAGCESQCDWRLVPPEQQFLHLLTPGTTKSGVAANNVTEQINRDQAGGTAIAAIGRLSDVVTDTGSDPTGLGRWSWIRLSNGKKSTRIMSGYLPCKPGRQAKGRTVWEQHSRYFQARNDFRYPSTILIEDITAQIQTWRQAGEEVILCIDSNQDVYTGPLALALQHERIQMTCMVKQALGEHVPNSHFRGSGKLSTIFGSPGLMEGNAMCYPHWYGVGDHRVFVVEISANSLFGGDYPAIARPTSRQLTCKITRVRNNYCNALKRLVHEHKMPAKLQKIRELSQTLPPTVSQTLHDNWDKELGEFMASAEKKCTKFRSCSIEYSPTVGQWLRRRSVLKWLLRWHDGKVQDTRNMCRAARRANIEMPLNLTREDILARLQACLQELFQLKSQAPALRKKHLRWRLSLAKERGDEEAAQEILRISRNEARRLRQRNINRVVRDPRGRSVLSVAVSLEGTEHHYSTQSEVEEICGQHLGDRFSLGRRAPLDAADLKAVIGNLSDTAAAQQILENTYDFSANWDPATVDLLKAAAKIRLEFNEVEQTSDDVTPDDFRTFWVSSKESTSSSRSGRHFGHYRAMSSDDELTSLQVASINIAASRGTPLTRWRQGVTVLLEKIAGNTRIDKLRAICLLEADFNWWLKATFAKKMVHRMSTHGVLPVEQGATAGKTAADSSMLKQLFFDQANTLHRTCAISSNDAANCYDAVNHAAGSFALQAMRVPLNFIKCYLVCIQLMRFYLKTGFGMATVSYGGTEQCPYMGLAQGSGASPAAWTAISTVMVAAYKAKGFGAYFRSGWSCLFLAIAALLYVDDTDLLHMSSSEDTSEEDFVTHTQTATTYWAKLLQSTGGNLKPVKCYWYLLSYKFRHGIASLRPLREISHHKITITQPDGSEVLIQLKGPSDASQVLGVWSCPHNYGQKQLEYMLKKGRRWNSRVNLSTLSPAEVWHSFKLQALPSVKYGLLTLMAPRQTLDNAFMAWYFTFLPALGINRHITKEWRSLPISFQGLGLPQMSLEKLSTSLQYIQRHWGNTTTVGQALRSVYELTQLEIGLSGNFLKKDYDKYGLLATHSWFKLLWEYLHHYGVVLELSGISIPHARQGDKVLMDIVTNIIPRKQWASFNRARRYYKIYLMSQLVLSDGITVNPLKLTPVKQEDSKMVFPLEQPTPADFKLWKETIALLTSPTFRLSPKLGSYLRPPYDAVLWMTNAARDYIVRQEKGKESRLYFPKTTRYATRGRQEFNLDTSITTIPTCTHIASVSPISQISLVVHSQSLMLPTQRSEQAFNLRQKLRNLGANSFARGLTISGEGEWMEDAIRKGSMVICHDGSFMPDLDSSRCSASTVFACTETGNTAVLSFCEYTDPNTASNYRGELLGGVIAMTVLRALIDNWILTVPLRCKVYCDNMGVVTHAHRYTQNLPENQVHADLLTLIRRSLSCPSLLIEYKHVHGHLDDTKSFSDLSLPQQLNVMADFQAKETLLSHVAQNIILKPYYPLEPVHIILDGKKVTASFRSALYKSWGTKVAIELFQRRRIVSTYNFHLIAWNTVHKAMDSYPSMFRAWITKHVSGFNGTNKQLARIVGERCHQCPCCGHEFESSSHITRCPNPGRRQLFHASVDKLLDWMESTHCDIALVECIEQYLFSYGEGLMTEITTPHPHLHEWAIEHDVLGWDNFLEGRIGLKMFELQHASLRRKQTRLHIKTWSTEFIHKVLTITHDQWTFRNARVHIQLMENKTAEEHDSIMEAVLDRLKTSPGNLLPQHRHLMELDFAHLGEGTTADRQYWIATIDSALQAATHGIPQRIMALETVNEQEITHDVTKQDPT